mmetsp:Transcript_12247/g.22676  ORF Transcript_12247/g.22676 Transcript_12247/m.22676 type:complete len:514 (+) Transcript_12247:79-1620(+)
MSQSLTPSLNAYTGRAPSGGDDDRSGAGEDAGVETLDKRWRPPKDWIDSVIKHGTIFPDEREPYNARSFHANMKGYDAGHKDHAAREKWFEGMKEELRRFGSWEKINIHETDADYAMQYGDHALGTPFPFNALKPMLEMEKEKMTELYQAQVTKAMNEETAIWRELMTNPGYKSYLNRAGNTKPEQPNNTLEGLYKGCLGVLPELWDLTEQVAEAGGSHDYSWSIKTLLRTVKKMVEKYQGLPKLCTDIIRTSIVFDTLEDMLKGMDFAMGHAHVVRVKNRFREPELGYSDILLNIRHSSNFISEIQLHLASVHYIKGTSGHQSFKWFRRLVRESDVYHGDRNDAGQRHGYGRWSGAKGDTYEGHWKDDMKHGDGVYTEAEGHRYVGPFKEDKRSGECVFTYFDGSQYTGSYEDDKKHGHGTFQYADGQCYEGQWRQGKRHGKGTFTYADGSSYSGDWQHHKRHGVGMLTLANGKVKDGHWKDDEFAPPSGPWFMIQSLCCSCQESSNMVERT